MLYVSEELFNEVYVYSFPGLKFVGYLSGFSLPAGLCSDRRGNVFVTDLLGGKIVEYEHGGSTPIAILIDRHYPQGCSVDPVSGDLAVADYGSSGDRGDLAIFRHARGSPAMYRDRSMISLNNCTYDDRGNLVADGQRNGNEPGLVELAAGARRLKVIAFDHSFNADGSLQWDGRYVTLMGNAPKQIYRISIAASGARLVGRTTLASIKYAFAFWLEGDTLIMTYVPPHTRVKYTAAGLWKYPAGGAPVTSVGNILDAYGVTVSSSRPCSRSATCRPNYETYTSTFQVR